MGVLAEGVFEQELIGTSSTRRELTALVRAVRHENLASVVAGKVVRVNMDSAAGVAKLMKGGGPKVELCRLVKEWFFTCRRLELRRCTGGCHGRPRN